MRTVETKIFKFGELSEKAKDRAIYDYKGDKGYLNADEAFASIKKLAEHFGGRMVRYSVDFFACSHSSMNFEMPDDNMPASEIRRRLKELGTYNRKTLKGNGDCKLTGYCTDEDAIDGFRQAFVREKETHLEKLMQAAFKTWLQMCQDDCEDFYSYEVFEEHCDANSFEFYEDGSFFVR